MSTQREMEANLIGSLPSNFKNRVRKPMGNPEFPGKQFGGSIQAIRNWIKKQKRARGFLFDLVAGQLAFDVEISGTAKIFLGFALIPDDPDVPNATMDSFVINNEIVIQDTDERFFQAPFTDEEYYWFPRPLSGTDSVTVTFTSPVAKVMKMIIYYL